MHIRAEILLLLSSLVSGATALDIGQQIHTLNANFAVSMRRRIVKVLTDFVRLMNSAEHQNRTAAVRNDNVCDLRRLNVDQQRLTSRQLVENFRQFMRDYLTLAVRLEKMLVVVDGDDWQVGAVDFRYLLDLDDVCRRLHRSTVDLMIVVMLVGKVSVLILVHLLSWRVIMVSIVMIIVGLRIPERMMIVISFWRLLIPYRNIVMLLVTVRLVDHHVMIVDLRLLCRRWLRQQIVMRSMMKTGVLVLLLWSHHWRNNRIDLLEILRWRLTRKSV